MSDPSNVGSRFEGYTNKEASEKKILRDVFEPGDAWIRTGDLMRKDEKGYFYFVDRIGDTFRRKGENVATSEVSEAICAFPGVKHANVYGVAVPGTEGRVGMAALVAEQELDLDVFRKHLVSRLPPYARPCSCGFAAPSNLTGTFKYSKTDLVRQGYDPVRARTRSTSTTLNRTGSSSSTSNCTIAFSAAGFDCSFQLVRNLPETMSHARWKDAGALRSTPR